MREFNLPALIFYERYVHLLHVGSDSSVQSLKKSICEKWSELTPLSFDLYFERDGKTHDIDSDDDLLSFSLLGWYNHVHNLQIFVRLRESLSITVYNEDIASSSSGSSLVVNSWGQAIAGVGQKFKDAKCFREALKKYCLDRGFKIDFIKNDTQRVTACCKRKKETNCLWRIHASMKLGQFEIKRFESTHTCGAGVKDVNNPGVSSRLVCSEIIEEVRDRPLIRPKEIIADFRRKHGVVLNYYYAYTGREMALKEVHGTDELSYHQLIWFSDAVRKSNPGSHVVLQTDPVTCQFRRFFICYEACIYGFKYCRPMLFLDGTFLKSKYRGVMLAATGKNADQGMWVCVFSILIIGFL